MNNFKIKALAADNFLHLFDLDDNELTKIHARRMIVDSNPGFPCRISLQDAEIGEEVILLEFLHHDVNSPYRGSGAIFIRKNVSTAELEINQVPKMLEHRLLSLRAYDAKGIMRDAQTVEGNLLSDTIEGILNNKSISYIHIHNASPGCYNCVVERA